MQLMKKVMLDTGVSRKAYIRDITTVCVILHNMIIEDERDLTHPFEIENIGSSCETFVSISGSCLVDDEIGGSFLTRW
jgi:hypothetical protein